MWKAVTVGLSGTLFSKHSLFLNQVCKLTTLTTQTATKEQTIWSPMCCYCSKFHKQNNPELLRGHNSQAISTRHVHNLTLQHSTISGRNVRYYSSVKAENAAKTSLAKSIPLRRQRKKTLEDVEDPPHHRNAVSYAVGEDLRLPELKAEFVMEGLYDIVALPRDLRDVLLVTAKIKVDGQARDAFFFSDGSIAFWNMSESERHELMKMARKHADNPYDITTILREVEKMPVQYDRSTKLVKDTIHLQKQTDGEETDHAVMLQKYAFSNALAQSVTLSINECNLEKFIEQLEPETQKLRTGQKSGLRKRDINMKLGEIFSLRHEINLESGFLDTPDIYWEREEIEQLYRDTVTYLMVPKRIRVLNERLNYCSEILQLFNNQLNDEHHVRLEWIIIILILIEVVFECFHYAERFGYMNINKVEEVQVDNVPVNNTHVLHPSPTNTDNVRR